MAPPCPLSRRVPQDVWDVILKFKPRDRRMSSPSAACLRHVPRVFFVSINVNLLPDERTEWRIRGDHIHLKEMTGNVYDQWDWHLSERGYVCVRHYGVFPWS